MKISRSSMHVSLQKRKDVLRASVLFGLTIRYDTATKKEEASPSPSIMTILIMKKKKGKRNMFGNYFDLGESIIILLILVLWEVKH